MQWIMHDWSDESCVKILKNCRKAIPEESGKVIIVDVVLQPEGNGLFDDTGLVYWKEEAFLATISSKFQLYCPLLRRTLSDIYAYDVVILVIIIMYVIMSMAYMVTPN